MIEEETHLMLTSAHTHVLAGVPTHIYEYHSCLSKLKLTFQCKDRKSHRSLSLDEELQIINKCWEKDDYSSLGITSLEGFPMPGGQP